MWPGSANRWFCAILCQSVVKSFTVGILKAQRDWPRDAGGNMKGSTLPKFDKTPDNDVETFMQVKCVLMLPRARHAVADRHQRCAESKA